MTSRTERLRSRLYRKPPEICLERARLYTDSWLETEGKPLVVRRAMALTKVLKEMTIYIEDGELVVGNHASRAFSVPLFPEFSVSWMADEMDRASTSRFVRPVTAAVQLTAALVDR